MQNSYEIAVDMGIDGLIEKVNAMVADGYRPIGVLMRVDGYGYRQPMWKEPREIGLESAAHGRVSVAALDGLR